MNPNKQTLLLNREAILLDSCDSLFATDDFINERITPYFPFIESIFNDLIQRLKKEGNVSFFGVSTKHAFLPGYYDYIFILTPNKKEQLIQWQILDATDNYTIRKAKQQTYQENIIFSQRKSRSNRS